MRGNDQEYRRQLATRFYRTFCPSQLAEIEFINFDYPVRDVAIEKDTRLCGFKDPRVSPLHRNISFFCVPGTPHEILGVSATGGLKHHPRVLAKVMHDYIVLVRIPHALESVCADGIDSWSLNGGKVPVGGGGWQYKVPEAYRYVRYSSSFPQRPGGA